MELFGGMLVLDPGGEPIALSPVRTRVLAVLVASPTPVHRTDLARCVGLSPKSLNSLLARLPADLGLERRVHVVADDGPKRLGVDRTLISSDVDEVRALRFLAERDEAAARRVVALVGRARSTRLGLVAGHPLGIAVCDELARVRQDGLIAVARLVLAANGRSGALLDEVESHPDDPLPLLLARLDTTARSRGREAARDLAASLGVGDVPEPTGPPPSRPPAALVARAIIETVQVPTVTATSAATLPPPGSSSGVVDRVLSGLDAVKAPVVSLHCPDLDADAFSAVLSGIRRTDPTVLGCWHDRRPPPAVLADLVEGPLAAWLREPDVEMSADLLRLFLAVRDGETAVSLVESDTLGRRFLDLDRARNGARRRLVVVGRNRPSSPAVDLMLAALLRHGPGLRLAILHSGPGRPRHAEFEARGHVALPALRRPAARRPAVRDRAGASPAPRRPTGPDERNLLAVASVAADRDGRLLIGLADHLLGLTGSSRTVADLIGADPEDPAGVGDRVGTLSDPDGLTGQLDGSDRRWLVGEAVEQVLADGVSTDLAVTVLDRLVGLVPAGSGATATAVAIRNLAGDRAGRSAHSEAIALLDVAARLPLGPGDEVAVLTQRAASQRELGRWLAALQDYRRCLGLLGSGAGDAADVALVADLVLGMARLTWDATVGAEVDELLHLVRSRLPADEPVLRARIELCLAGGSFQDGIAGTDRVDPESISRALEVVGTSVDPTDRAWGLVHGRKALLEILPASESIGLAQGIVQHGHDDTELMSQGQQALFVDGVRLARWETAHDALLEMERSALDVASAEHRFIARVARVCWELAHGRYDAARSALDEVIAFGPLLQGSTFDQVALAQLAWLTRKEGRVEDLVDLVDRAAERAALDAGRVVWAAGAALLAIDVGQLDRAVTLIGTFARKQGGFDRLAAGSHRLPTLALASVVAASAASVGGAAFPDGELEAIRRGLDETANEVVLIGWPALILGPVDRFRALIRYASGDLPGARRSIGRAVLVDGHLPGVNDETTAAGRLIDGAG